MALPFRIKVAVDGGLKVRLACKGWREAREKGRPWSLLCRSLQGNQGDVIFLLPLISGELLQLGQQRINQRRTAWVCTNKLLQSWSTKHLTPWVVSLDQSIAVEEDTLSRLQCDLLLFVAHVGHQTQRHPRSTEFAHTVGMPQVRQVVSGIGVLQPTSPAIQEGGQTGNEHAGRDLRVKNVVDPFEYLARRVRGLGASSQRAAGCGHQQGCWHAMAGGVPHDQS